MKKFFILSCFLLGLIVSANSYIIYESPYTIDVYSNDKEKKEWTTADQMSMQGRLTTVKPKSLFEPVVVYKDDVCIEINFFSTLGNIDIAIYDGSSNQVHHSNVNPVVGDEKTINISSLPAGVYKLQLTDTGGGLLYGIFEVN